MKHKIFGLIKSMRALKRSQVILVVLAILFIGSVTTYGLSRPEEQDVRSSTTKSSPKSETKKAVASEQTAQPSSPQSTSTQPTPSPSPQKVNKKPSTPPPTSPTPPPSPSPARPKRCSLMTGGTVHSAPDRHAVGIGNVSVGPGCEAFLFISSGQPGGVRWEPKDGSFVWSDGQTQSSELPYSVMLPFPKISGGYQAEKINYTVKVKDGAPSGTYTFSFYVHYQGQLGTPSTDIFTATLTISN